VSLSRRTSITAKVLGAWHPIALYLAGGIVAALLVLLVELTPVQYGWLVIVGGAVAGITLVRPLAGLYLLPFAVAFGSLFTLSVHGLNASLTDILVAALVVSAAYRVWRKAVARERSHQLEQFHPSYLALFIGRDPVPVGGGEQAARVQRGHQVGRGAGCPDLGRAADPESSGCMGHSLGYHRSRNLSGTAWILAMGSTNGLPFSKR
jgi:uncharacterized membrane protein YccC